MKNIIIIILLTLLSFTLKGQEADTTKYKFCEIGVTPKLIKHWEFTIRIDSGNVKKSPDVSSFTSVVETLNYMSNKGWELIQVYIIPSDESVNEGTGFRQFLLKKKIKK